MILQGYARSLILAPTESTYRTSHCSSTVMLVLSFVCILRTITSSLYLAVVSTHMAVGRFRSPVRRSGTHCLTSSEIRGSDMWFWQF